MLRIACLVAVLVAMQPAHAQTATPDTDNGRFTFSQIKDELLRLDTRTGQVSICSRGTVSWTCQAVPDERAALEGEIARLQGETAVLKREMIARGLPLPDGMRSDSQAARPQIELKLPNEADLDRLMSFMDKIWRRLIDLVQGMQKQADRKG